MEDFDPVPLMPGAQTSVFLTVTAGELGTEGPVIDAAFAALRSLQRRQVPEVRESMCAGLHAAAVALGRVRAAGLTFAIDPVQHHDPSVGVGNSFSIVMLMVDITVLDRAESAADDPPGTASHQQRVVTSAEALDLISQIWSLRPGGEFGRQLSWLASLADGADVGSEVVARPGGGRPVGARYDLATGGTVTVYPPQGPGSQMRVELDGDGVTDGVVIVLFNDMRR